MSMTKLCDDCQKFVKKYKPWNEKKVPVVALVMGSKCNKCRMSYSVYRNMIQAIPKASKEEIREMKEQRLNV